MIFSFCRPSFNDSVQFGLPRLEENHDLDERLLLLLTCPEQGAWNVVEDALMKYFSRGQFKQEAEAVIDKDKGRILPGGE